MNTKRRLCDFSINEYKQYVMLMEDFENNMGELFELFGLDISEMNIDELYKAQIYIINETPEKPELERGMKIKYKCKDGTVYHSTPDITKMTAQQFISFQLCADEDDIAKTLSTILIPMEHKYKMIYKKRKYNVGYSTEDVYKHIGDNITIGDAQEMAFFLLIISQRLLELIQEYSLKQKVIMLMEKNKIKIK